MPDQERSDPPSESGSAGQYWALPKIDGMDRRVTMGKGLLYCEKRNTDCMEIYIGGGFCRRPDCVLDDPDYKKKEAACAEEMNYWKMSENTGRRSGLRNRTSGHSEKRHRICSGKRFKESARKWNDIIQKA